MTAAKPAVEVSDLTGTVQYARKVGRENYGNEELGLFLQFNYPKDASAQEIDMIARAAIAQAKATVLTQSGREFTQGDDGVVLDKIDPQVESNKRSFKKPAQQSSASSTDKAELWEQLKNDPDKWWDNREGKKNPKAPDFKEKTTGDALWLNSRDTPEWATEQYAA